MRKATYTHACIVERKAFTIGIACESRMVEADYMGIASGRDVDKFAVTGLTFVKSELVDAPYASEFPVVLECRLLHIVEIGLHTQFIGEVKDVKIDGACLDAEGHVDVGKLDPLAFAPDTGAYFALGALIGGAYSIGKSFTTETSS